MIYLNHLMHYLGYLEKKALESVREPLHGNLMFGDQSSVDDFVANTSNRGTSVSDKYWCTQTRIYCLGMHIHNSVNSLLVIHLGQLDVFLLWMRQRSSEGHAVMSFLNGL